jgi:hypothetical protein
MHTSYVSLAVFAMGAAAVPNMPKPNGNPFGGSTFPFMPSGSSSVEGDDGMSNPVPAYMAAMEAVESAQAGAYSNPTPPQQAGPSSKPYQPETPIAQVAPEPIAQPAEQAPQPAPIAEEAQPIQPNPVEPKPVAPKPDSDDNPEFDAKPASDDNQEFDVPMSQPSAPALENPIPAIPEYALPSSMSSVVAHVKPSPAFSEVYEYSSSMSIMVSMPASSSMAPLVIQATPAPESMPMEMAPVTINTMPVQSVVQTSMAKPSSFTTRPIVALTSPTVTKPTAHSANIHEQHLSSMSARSSVMHATESSSATPSPSAHVVEDAASMLGKIPVVGGLLSTLGGLF